MSIEVKTITGRYEKSYGKDNIINYGVANLSLSIFSGGKENGPMLQMTIDNSETFAYVQLTQEQVKSLICTMNKIVKPDTTKSLPEYNEVYYHAKADSIEQFENYWNQITSNEI